MDVRHELNGTTFVWNVEKARLNLRNHGVAFEQAAEVFFDPFFRLVDAGRNDEHRDAVIGYDSGSRLLCVVHVEIEGEIFRIISARKATSPERETYDS
jgi:uncharacterized DUF497 family protein